MKSFGPSRLAVGKRWNLLVLLISLAFSDQTGFADEQGWVKVEGLLRDRQGERPLGRMAVAISSKDGTVKEAVCVTDAKGRFEFEFYGAALKGKDSASDPICVVLPVNEPGWSLAWCDPAKPRSEMALIRLAGSREPAGWRFDNGRRWLYVETDAPGDLETTVRDPAGKPLANTELQVVSKRSAVELNDADRVRWRGKTDSQGQIRLRCSSKRFALHLLVPGLGCGFTAPVTVIADQSTRVELPPLVPFARIAGTVMTAFDPGDEIETGRFGWDERRSRIPPDGRFELTDVVPGFCHLRLRKAAPPDRVPEVLKLLDLTVAPSQDIADLKLGAAERYPKPDSLPPVQRPAATEMNRVPFNDSKATVFATGRVTDVSGQPLPDCRVIVTNQYHGGLRMYETTVETKTAADGTYRTDGIRLGAGGVGVAVFAPGKPVAYARGVAVGVPGTGRGVVVGFGGIETVPTLESASDEGNVDPHVRADVIVPERGGSVIVRVLDQQRTVNKGIVRLQLNDWYQRTGFGWARADGKRERELRDSTWQFTQPIDAQGLARFDRLPAGEFTAFAVAGTEQDVAAISEHVFGSPNQSVPARQHRGMISAAGESREYTLQLGPRHLAVPIRLLNDEGEPIGVPNIGIQFHPVASGASRTTGRDLDADGQMKFEFDAPGLWQMQFLGQRGGVQQIPVRSPQFTGETLVGVSALLSPQPTREIRLGATRQSTGATLRVLDREGRPARAFVRISDVNPDGIPVAMGGTDAYGEFQLTEYNATRNHAIVVSFANHRPLPPLSVAMSDEQLLAGRGPLVSRSFFGNGRVVEVREQPQGFVRGRAEFHAGLRREDYRLEILAENVQCDFDPTTGEFLVGPLSTNEVRLAWRHRGSAPTIDAENALLVANAIVELDAVTHCAVRPRSVLQSELWSNRRSDWNPVAGRVRMSDGTTPTGNTRFLTFAPNARQPVSAGWSDPLGRFTTEALRVHGQSGDVSTRNGLKGSVLMAWIPGQTARAFLPLTFDGEQPKELNVVLPRGHRVRGRVTIADESALNIAAPITIAVRHERPDPFASLLGSELTANADGTFDFVGLNPGHYSCQAALDDLWLSPTIELDVTADRENVSLNIPAPGGTARLRLVGPDGSPWRRHPIEVDWPLGPLTSRFRPASLATDSGGELFLDGAASDTLRVRLRGKGGWHSIAIPKLAGPSPELQTISVSANSD